MVSISPVNSKPRMHYWFLPGVKKATVMKMSRMLHGYLSAFAFIALMFFSVSGLLLNHPDWFKSASSRQPLETLIQLAQTDVGNISGADDPEATLRNVLPRYVALTGTFKSAESFENEIILRFSSAKGDTTIFADPMSGQVSVVSKKASVSSIIRELHRGKDTAKSWRFMIDLTAIVTLLLSLIGFFLFFTIRYRLRKSLVLCGSSLAVFAILYIWAIP